MIPLAVTVSARNPGRHSPRARALAAEWGLPFIEREERSPIESLLERAASALLVLSGDGWALHDAQGELRFSPGMAQVRIRRLQHHDAHPEVDPTFQDDMLLKLCALQPGDQVFDATLGLAADALVCAWRVGSEGRVIGVEASLPLFALVSQGLAAHELGPRLDVRHGDALAIMKREPSRSVDCVILDPMFEKPRSSAPPFEVLRRHAVHEPMGVEVLHEAQRLARRVVVIKGGRSSNDFRRLGLKPVPSHKLGPLMWATLPPLS